MPFSRRTTDARRIAFLNLASQIESQLRDEFERQHAEGKTSQAILSKKLGVNKSAIHRRLMGCVNMTTETIADMVWALDCAIKVKICEPTTGPVSNQFIPTFDSSSVNTPGAKIAVDKFIRTWQFEAAVSVPTNRMTVAMVHA